MWVLSSRTYAMRPGRDRSRSRDGRDHSHHRDGSAPSGGAIDSPGGGFACLRSFVDTDTAQTSTATEYFRGLYGFCEDLPPGAEHVLETHWRKISSPQDFATKCYWYTAGDPFRDRRCWWKLVCRLQVSGVERAATQLLAKATLVKHSELALIGCGIDDLMANTCFRQTEVLEVLRRLREKGLPNLRTTPHDTSTYRLNADPCNRRVSCEIDDVSSGSAP